MKPFRKTVTKNGKKTKVSTWSIRYRNAEGKRQEEHGFLTEEEAWFRLKEAKKEVEDERVVHPGFCKFPAPLGGDRA